LDNAQAAEFPFIGDVGGSGDVDIFGQPLNVTNAPIVSAGGRRVGDHTNPILQPGRRKSWSATVICRPGLGAASPGEWPEAVCAENPHESSRQAALPTADNPDF
jgi:hypothetical protein